MIFIMFRLLAFLAVVGALGALVAIVYTWLSKSTWFGDKVDDLVEQEPTTAELVQARKDNTRAVTKRTKDITSAQKAQEKEQEQLDELLGKK